MFFFLVFVSIFLAIRGVTLLSEATLGVGVICLAVLMAIWARLVQAHTYHKRERQALEETLNGKSGQSNQNVQRPPDDKPPARDIHPPYVP